MRKLIANLMVIAMAAFGISAIATATTAKTEAPTVIRVTPAIQYTPVKPHVELVASFTAAAVRHVTPRRLSAYRWARGQTGKPYCWGGTGPGCYDCSGLVMEAYEHAGISLPRTTEEMQSDHRLYRVRHPRRGDIVLYGWPAFHAALYAGNGMIFDALNQETPVGWQPKTWPGQPIFYRVAGANVWRHR